MRQKIELIPLRSLLPRIFVRGKKHDARSRWEMRQMKDKHVAMAKADGFRSRAAYKLQELDSMFRLFKPGMTVVDLGFAPGAWSQVAAQRVRPGGRVIGVDILPCIPPPGVSSIQGNFLSKETQNELKRVLAVSAMGVPKEKDSGGAIGTAPPSYLDTERELGSNASQSVKEPDFGDDYPVDIVLSDMMANVSGIAVRDHAASIDLCDAALLFAIDTLKIGGSFACKVFTGEEDKFLQQRLKRMFHEVKRRKPEATRKESKELYLVGLKRRKGVTVESVFGA
ncbi:Ribosomal RNA large subunit methyltransferase E [Yarrowia sp. B02]|nr:Ribosomal RNA large subunit methyltransferase E [Yarrowia sp. B02]